jgi:hypothetical protein
MNDMSPLKQAYLGDVDLLIKGKPCWLHGVKSFLTSLFGNTFPRERSAILSYVGMLSLEKVRKAMIGKWRQFWNDVESGGIDASKCMFYHTHVACDDVEEKRGWFAPAPHFRVYMPGDVHSNLVRFRLGNHNLLTEKRRWLKGDRRSTFDCTCTFCTVGEEEDEHHFVFRCVHFENIRLEDAYFDIFETSRDSLKIFLNHTDQIRVAKLVSDLLFAHG